MRGQRAETSTAAVAAPPPPPLLLLLVLLLVASGADGAGHRIELDLGAGTYGHFSGATGAVDSGTQTGTGERPAAWDGVPAERRMLRLNLAGGLYFVDPSGGGRGRDVTTSFAQRFTLDVPAQTSAGNAGLRALASGRHKSDIVTELAAAYPTVVLYEVFLRSYAPYVVYGLVANASSAAAATHECDVVLAVAGAGGLPMTCRVTAPPAAAAAAAASGATAARVEPVTVHAGGGVASVTVFLEDGLHADAVAAYLSLAAYRLHKWKTVHDAVARIEVHNADRSHNARMATAWIYFFIAVGVVVWSALFALFFSWAFPVIVPPEAIQEKGFAGPEGRVKFNCLIVTILSISLNFLVSGTAGFTGWVVMGLLYFIGIVSIGIAFISKKFCCKSKDASKVYPDDESAAAVAVSPTHVPVVEDDADAADADDRNKQRSDNDGAAAPEAHPEGPQPPSAPPAPPVQPAVPAAPAAPRWATLKDVRMGKTQGRIALGYSLGMLLILILLIIVVFAWSIPDYRVYNRAKQADEAEVIPVLTAKVIQMMYAWNGLATNLKLYIYTKWLTQWCGRKYRETLSASGKESAIKSAFIDEYEIDMLEYHPSDIMQYSTVNEWFIRGLAPGARPHAPTRLTLGTRAVAPGNASLTIARPLEAGHTNTMVLSPADCRMLIFPTMAESRVWVKGSRFNYKELLDGGFDDSLFVGGAMAIARLAPQDYHRFNCPIDATVVRRYELSGTYWSVNADAATSRNYAFYNLRKVLILRYTGSDGTQKHLAYVAIGATCVGSVILTPNTAEGSVVKAGDELGFMQFGGSTILMLFMEGEFIADDDMLYNSQRPVESVIKVNERMGTLA